MRPRQYPLVRTAVSRCLVFAVLAVGAVGHAADGRSEPSDKNGKAQSSDERRAQAQRLYEAAAKAYAKRRNFEAIELFRQSAELEPSPLLYYNMALAYEEAGDVRNALKYFRKYLSETPQAEDAAEVRSSVVRLEQKLQKLGIQQLSVTSQPAGATVYVDGTPAGVTPFTSELQPGAYELVLRLDGYEELRFGVNLPHDHALELPVTLKRQPPPTQRQPARAADVRADHPDGLEPLHWGVLGAGLGSLTAGVLFEVSRVKSSRRARAAGDPVVAAEARGEADGKQLASIFLLGAGGAFIVTGGVLLLLDHRAIEARGAARHSTARSPEASAACLPGFCGVQLSGSF